MATHVAKNPLRRPPTIGGDIAVDDGVGGTELDEAAVASRSERDDGDDGGGIMKSVDAGVDGVGGIDVDEAAVASRSGRDDGDDGGGTARRPDEGGTLVGDEGGGVWRRHLFRPERPPLAPRPREFPLFAGRKAGLDDGTAGGGGAGAAKRCRRFLADFGFLAASLASSRSNVAIVRADAISAEGFPKKNPPEGGSSATTGCNVGPVEATTAERTAVIALPN